MDTASAVIPPNYIDRLQAVAKAIGEDIYTLDQILRANSVSSELYNTAMEKPWFQNLVDDYRREFNSSKNRKERIIVKAQVALEEIIPSLARSAADPKESLNHRALMTQQLSRIAGIGQEQTNVATPGTSFQLNIHIGDSTTPINVTPRVNPPPVIDYEGAVDA